MRLEERKQAAAVAHRGEVGCELGRMMRVAVEDFDAARLVASWARAGDTVLTLGAGDVDRAAPLLLELLA